MCHYKPLTSAFHWGKTSDSAFSLSAAFTTCFASCCCWENPLTQVNTKDHEPGASRCPGWGCPTQNWAAWGMRPGRAEVVAAGGGAAPWAGPAPAQRAASLLLSLEGITSLKEEAAHASERRKNLFGSVSRRRSKTWCLCHGRAEASRACTHG